MSGNCGFAIPARHRHRITDPLSQVAEQPSSQARFQPLVRELTFGQFAFDKGIHASPGRAVRLR
jgi:hypothetical protein